MPLPWFKVHTAFFAHPKVRRLERILDEPLAGLFVLRIWAHAAEYLPAGKLTGGRSGIEVAAGWRGRPGTLADALIRVGFVDELEQTDEDGEPILELHDWADLQQAHFEKAKVDAERKRELRETRRGNGARRFSAGPADGAGRSGAAALVRRGRGAGETKTETETKKLTTLSNQFDRVAGQPELPINDLPKSEKPSTTPKSDQALEVFAHWRKVMGRTDRTAFDKPRRRAVEARIEAGFTVADLNLAVDGCAQTPHNMGQNDRGERYDDLALICRDAGQVERFMHNAKNPPRANGAAPVRKPVTTPLRPDEDLYPDRPPQVN